MPQGKKGFSKGADVNIYRSRARDGQATSREAAGAAMQQIGQLLADGTYTAAEGLRQVRILLERQEGIADAGAECAAGDEGGSAKRPRDSTVAGPAGQRCALPSCGVLLYNAQAVALDGESIDAAPRALCARPSLLSPF